MRVYTLDISKAHAKGKTMTTQTELHAQLAEDYAEMFLTAVRTGCSIEDAAKRAGLEGMVSTNVPALVDAWMTAREARQGVMEAADAIRNELIPAYYEAKTGESYADFIAAKKARIAAAKAARMARLAAK